MRTVVGGGAGGGNQGKVPSEQEHPVPPATLQLLLSQTGGTSLVPPPLCEEFILSASCSPKRSRPFAPWLSGNSPDLSEKRNVKEENNQRI